MYDNSTSSSAGGSAAALVLLVLFLAFLLVFVVADWRIFSKAGEAGWKSLVPLYSTDVLFRIAGFNPWTFLLMFIPVANVVLAVLLALGLGERFQKGPVWSVILLWLFSPIGHLILAFGPATFAPNRRITGL